MLNSLTLLGALYHLLNLSDGRKLSGNKEEKAYGTYDSRLEQIEYYITQRLKEIINLSK